MSEESLEKEVSIEDLARDIGWQSPDEYNGDDSNYIDAETFIRNGQIIQNNMRDSIKDQKQQLNDMSLSLSELKTHNERVYKVEVNRLTKEVSRLTKEKTEAIEAGDVERVEEIDEEIGAARQDMLPVEDKPVTVKKDNPEYDEWIKVNEWYKTDKEMSQYADMVADQNQGVSFKRVSALVQRKVKEMFPEKFHNDNKTAMSRVEGATRQAGNVRFTKSDLTDDQRNIMSQFVRQGIMSEKEYISDIAKMEGDL